jgi:hypothetical protein
VASSRRRVITLRPAPTASGRRDSVPGWGAAAVFLRRHPQVELHYGADDTGDLYSVDNIDAFVAHVGEQSCDLVTADGGFDFSDDFCRQEESSARLILCEIYAALRLVNAGGSVVCKFFDVQLPITVDLVSALAHNCQRISITKPACSRPANSERYVVAQGYHGAHAPKVAASMRQMIGRLADDAEAVCFARGARLFVACRPHVQELIAEYNLAHIEAQTSAIRMCFGLIDTRDNGGEATEAKLCRIMKRQIKSGCRWCRAYGVEINPNCIYLATK